MKYPLTDNAKELARQLVQAWDEEKIKQRSTIGGDNIGFIVGTNYGINIDFQSIYPALLELNKYGIIDFHRQFNGKSIVYLELLLLQELRNAVATDFEVSEYFLTMNAVGNIIINSTTGYVQGVGYAGGDVNQTMTVHQIADDLTRILDQSLLDSHEELRLAIEALRVSNEQEKPSRIKKIGIALGNMLGLGADAVTIAPALAFLIALL